MKKMVPIMLSMLLFSPTVQAEGFMNWMENGAGSKHNKASEVALDHAVLLTLEAGETEMYPNVAPDGKYLLVLSSKKHHGVISRRLVENGDPINVVADGDEQELHSMQWFGNDYVTFLSHRANSLGLWKKPIDGGVIKRLHGRLDGELKDPIVLADGSIIAVRIQRAVRSSASSSKRKQQHLFDQWASAGTTSTIVIIDAKGERELASGVSPSLSPDGKHLVFSMQAGRSWHLFMMNTDGTELVELTEGRSVDVQPTWSPDGKWVAFTSNRAAPDMRHSKKSNWDVWMIGVDGKDLIRLTTDKAMDGAPAFANDGKIYFHSNRKVTKQDMADHQVNRHTKGFHIWSVNLPLLDEG